MTRPRSSGKPPVRRVAGSRRPQQPADRPAQQPAEVDQPPIEVLDTAPPPVEEEAPVEEAIEETPTKPVEEEKPRPRPKPGPSPRPRDQAAKPAAGAKPTAERPKDKPEEKPAARRSLRKKGGGIRPVTLWTAVAVLGVLVIALGAATWGQYHGYRSEQARSSAQDEALGAAKTAAARYVSFDYRHLTQDRDDTAALITGDFKKTYTDFMNTTIIPKATQLKAVVQGETNAAAVSSVNDDGTTAVVLAYVNTVNQNTNITGSRTDLSRLRLTMTEVDGNWLISKIEDL